VSKTLMRGLELIDEVGRHGPLTITELARRTGIHITIVSRTVRACEPAGWLMRVDGKIVTGPRCALLGLTSPVSETIREAEPLVGANAGVTGLSSAAAGLVGSDLMTLSTSGGEDLAGVADGLLSRLPVHVLAAGRAVAAQLPAERLDEVLPTEPYPGLRELLDSLPGSASLPTYLAGLGAGEGPGGNLPRTRKELDAQLESVRATGFARDHGETHPGVHCVAIPWPVAGLPAALACIGGRDAVEQAGPLIEACLRAAARPGAEARDVVEAAAHAGAQRMIFRPASP
jgi:IclR family transcriptional regulator, acetate operon repressor